MFAFLESPYLGGATKKSRRRSMPKKEEYNKGYTKKPMYPNQRLKILKIITESLECLNIRLTLNYPTSLQKSFQ